MNKLFLLCVSMITVVILYAVNAFADEAATAEYSENAQPQAKERKYVAKSKKAVIDIPSLCHKVEKVDYDNVYLVVADKNCTQASVPGKASVEVSPEVQAINIYDGGNLWKTQNISITAGISVEKLIELNEKAKQTAESMPLPTNKHEKFGVEKAQEFINVYNSQEFQQRIQKEVVRLKKELYKQPDEPFYKDDEKATTIPNIVPLAVNERVYIFVSSSMPMDALRNYAAAIDKARSGRNIVMVMRGFVNGLSSKNDTQKFAANILKVDPQCSLQRGHCDVFKAIIEIDPFLFRRYEITKVPTVVYAPSVEIVGNLGSEGKEENALVNKHFTIAGDASLDYMLETINKDAQKPSLDRVVSAIRKGYY